MKENATLEAISSTTDADPNRSASSCESFTSKRIWEIYPELVIAVKTSHETHGLKGHHDVYHAARVGDAAYRITLETWKDASKAHLAGIAGLCHNADRMLGLDVMNPPEDDITRVIHTWLNTTDLDHAARAVVTEAVLKHDKKNDPEDSDILIALKDADRIINLDLDVIIRAGQHNHDIPAIDYTHFVSSTTASYIHPGSVARMFAFLLEWVDPKSDVCIRTEIGLTMARQRAEGIQNYLDMLKSQLQSEGIFPAPF
jgi:hypothetical protein